MKQITKILLVLSLCIPASFAFSQTITSRLGHPPATGPVRFPHFPTKFGDPLRGLTTDQATNFTAGQAQFQKVDTAADGLGPIFNHVSCVACHQLPAIGGSSAIVETRFGKFAHGQFDPLSSEGNTLLHQMAIVPAAQESIPLDANVVALRKSTPLYGLGLIEAIPDTTIQANVHRPAVDGITGRPAILSDPLTTFLKGNVVGRFGWKCQRATILAFSGDAYLNEMGISNRLFPFDLAPNGNQAVLANAEPPPYTVAGNQDPPTNPNLPEGPDNKDDIARFTDFMQLIAPPPTVPLTATAQEGQSIFRQINCVACHKPVMMTGSSTIASLSFKPVALYSDLLLHDMGLSGDGIAQAVAGTTEMRTQPLWGLRARGPYLHDGRASTVDAAIRLHDGEAVMVRNRYIQLTPQQQQAVLDFLNSI